MPRVATVIFDLGRTLVPFSFAGLELRLAAHADQARALFGPFERGQIPVSEFRERMSELAGLAGADLDSWWNSIFEPRWLVPPAWLHQLQGQRRLGLMSNTNALHWAYLESAYPQLSQFDFRALSFEVGEVKPGASIYAAAEALAGCAPELIFYTDDIPAYVEAARQRGWQAAPFTSAAALAEALAAADPDLAHLALELRAAASRLNDNPSASASTTMRSGPLSPT